MRIGENQIGPRSYVGLYSYINGDVAIGEDVAIGLMSLSLRATMFLTPLQIASVDAVVEEGKVVIQRGVWLTTGVVITPGTTVGECALVCANSVVTSDVPAYAIVAGTPAKQVGRIDPESGQYHWFNKE